MKYGQKSTKFDGLIGEPINSPFILREQKVICNKFIEIGGNKPGWNHASIVYHIDADGNVDIIADTKIYSVGEEIFRSSIIKNDS